MSERASERLPLRPKTKKALDEQKPDGWTYDYWVRKQLGIAKDTRR
jgi:hypothetical protein